MKKQISLATFGPVLRDKLPLRQTLASVAVSQRLRKNEAPCVTTFLLAKVARRVDGGGR